MKRTITPCSARILRERNDLVVVEAAQDDTINLHWSKSCLLRCLYPSLNFFEAVGNPRNTGKSVCIDSIHAYRYAAQACAFQPRCLILKQVTVRRHRQVERISAETCAQFRRLADQFYQSLSQQGFATSQPHLFDAQVDEDAGQAQVIRDRQLGILCTLVASPAINAAIVTPVSN